MPSLTLLFRCSISGASLAVSGCRLSSVVVRSTVPVQCTHGHTHGGATTVPHGQPSERGATRQMRRRSNRHQPAGQEPTQVSGGSHPDTSQRVKDGTVPLYAELPFVARSLKFSCGKSISGRRTPICFEKRRDEEAPPVGSSRYGRASECAPPLSVRRASCWLWVSLRMRQLTSSVPPRRRR